MNYVRRRVNVGSGWSKRRDLPRVKPADQLHLVADFPQVATRKFAFRCGKPDADVMDLRSSREELNDVALRGGDCLLPLLGAHIDALGAEEADIRDAEEAEDGTQVLLLVINGVQWAVLTVKAPSRGCDDNCLSAD